MLTFGEYMQGLTVLVMSICVALVVSPRLHPRSVSVARHFFTGPGTNPGKPALTAGRTSRVIPGRCLRQTTISDQPALPSGTYTYMSEPHRPSGSVVWIHWPFVGSQIRRTGRAVPDGVVKLASVRARMASSGRSGGRRRIVSVLGS